MLKAQSTRATDTLCKEVGYQAKQSDQGLYPTTTDIRECQKSTRKLANLSKKMLT